MHESMQAQPATSHRATPPSLPQWSAADQTAAYAAGWALIDVDGHATAVEIQKLDEDPRETFRTDSEAVLHVLRRAKDLDGGALERRAIAYVRAMNYEYFEDVILDVAKRMGL